MFDINRDLVKWPLISSSKADIASELMKDEKLPATIDLVTKSSPPFPNCVSTRRLLDMCWPDGVYSLSYVALSFLPNNPLYGIRAPGNEALLFLGQLATKGERGILKVLADYFNQLRHNPFYSLLKERAVH